LKGDDFVEAAKILLDVVVSQMFGENAFIARLEGRGDCLVVDPGFDADRIIQRIEDLQLTPAAILNTHGHADHIAGNGMLKQRWPQCPLVIGADEAAKLTDPAGNLSGSYGIGLVSPPADRLVRDGETFEAAGIELEVLATPGHSCGHVIFLYKGNSPWIVFGGDVLFQGSVGRADFPDSDPRVLADSIRGKLYSLPEDTIVLPGHGDPTTIGRERHSNPFVRG
jgi:glyoxylase-like metal-dependent hydrolase (beta-lactamase superfamily II)